LDYLPLLGAEKTKKAISHARGSTSQTRLRGRRISQLLTFPDLIYGILMTTTRPSQKDYGTKSTRFLTFTLGQESYGLPVLHVREIIRICPITPVPNMPPHVRGVINLRGTVIAVLDLRAKFSMASVPAGERACIIVLQLGVASTRPTLIGIIVDAVEEVVQLGNSEIEPCPDFGDSTASQYILGIATLQGGVKTLLEIEKIFAEEGTITWQLLEHLPVNEEIRPKAFLKEGGAVSSQSPSSS
jgi:purine-binding chemotaxis protein CheW